MNTEHTQQNMQNTSSQLQASVLERIEKEHVQPMPKWQFVLYEYGIWCLWGLSVVIGAIAVAVMVFVSMHAGFAFYEATHETPLSFFIEVLPYLWIMIFIVMAVLAYSNMRKTKKGYKYPLWQILMSSLFFSVLGGIVLHYAGVGYLIDHAMGSKMPMYPSFEATELRMWQMPEEGRIVGRIEEKQPMDAFVRFVDIDDNQWLLNTQELMSEDIATLQSGKRVKVLGVVTSSSSEEFHGCGVFAWMMDPDVSLKDMKNERLAFVNRIYQHKERSLLAKSDAEENPVATSLALRKEMPENANMSTRALEEESLPTNTLEFMTTDMASADMQAVQALPAVQRKLCAELKAIQRIEARMQE